MGFFDLIHDLRTAAPDAAKASRAMKGFGWFCLLAGAWNFIVPSLAIFRQSRLQVLKEYPVLALVSLLLLGGLFFLSSRGIANREAWGKRLGQASVVLLVALFFGLMLLFFYQTNFPFEKFPRPFLIVFAIVFIGQFLVPAWFGIGYLGKLPVQEAGTSGPARSQPVRE